MNLRFSINQRARSAFTLVEVLLAIGIFGMVMVSVYSTWSAVLRASRVGLKKADEVQRARITLRALEESLSSAMLYVENAKYYAFFAENTKGGAFLSFVARLPESFPGSGVFEGQPVRRVTFSGQKGSLVMQQSLLLEDAKGKGEPYTIILAPSFHTFDMEFFDTQKGEWVADWYYTNQLPRMVRVALGFGEKTAANKAEFTIRTIRIEGTPITRVGAGALRGGQFRGGPGGPGGEGVVGAGAPTGDDLWLPPHLPGSFGGNAGNPSSRSGNFP